MSKGEAVKAAHEALYLAVCALSVGDIDGHYRSSALQELSAAYDYVIRGLKAREDERQRAEEARIIEAYRKGRLVEVGP